MAKILVAEDDVALNRLTVEYLKDYGYEADGYFNGLDAYNVYKKGGYDMIVSDVMMPKMDGFALVKKVIDLCGGEISVKSVVGKGSTFTVKLKSE